MQSLTLPFAFSPDVCPPDRQTAVDRLGLALPDAQRAAVQEVFVTGSRYEWMFWDMGWRLEQWPV